MNVIEDLRHMTWRGRYEAVVDGVWRFFHHPVDPDVQCIMGYPIGGIARCPRPIESPGGLWCARHEPEEPK